ncbi:MAG TPA: hypothetical protein VFK11_00365 [Candidatus Saccharimonadales bacterium]|nr:hypothetical protein [Candidatus Saccharimonadales bacterium]
MNLISWISTFAVADKECIRSFLGIPPWFEYLDVKYLPSDPVNSCTPRLNGINDLWLIGLAVIEILTRIAVLVALGYVIFAGIKYSESRGNSDKVTKAKSTLIDALTGLIIALVATSAVSFFAGRFTQ